MATHARVQWLSPAPFWNDTASEAFRVPQILRFDTDEFMDEFMNLLANQSEQLPALKAKPEQWNGSADPKDPLLLYQPAHQRFYLVTAALVCRMFGLPDRKFSAARQEKASFVVRRLMPAEEAAGASYDEYAFIVEAEGSHWLRLGPAGSLETRLLAKDEEQTNLFAVQYQDDERNHRVLAGLIPVGKREKYLGSPKAAPVQDEEAAPLPLTPTNDPRLALLLAQVIEPWNSLAQVKEGTASRLGSRSALISALLAQGYSAGDTPYDQALAEYDDQIGQTERQVEMGSWYILLDLDEFLQAYQIRTQLLETLTALGGPSKNLADGLKAIGAHRTRLEGATLSYNPDIGGALAYPPGPAASLSYSYNSTTKTVSRTAGWPNITPVDVMKSLVLENNSPYLVDLVAEALKDAPQPAAAPALPLAAQQAALAQDTVNAGGNLSDPDWFIVRCVFNRPKCRGQAKALLSEPTERFQMASFFDPLAPARPVRVSLPLDTSPAGLRKFSKNASFILSDVLACQLEQVKGLTLADLVLSVLPWPFHKSLPTPSSGACKDPGSNQGAVCSLSIPIVTICAMIVLMIMVNLFDYIFRWLPYLMVCFRIPGLKGKESS